MLPCPYQKLVSHQECWLRSEAAAGPGSLPLLSVSAKYTSLLLDS